MATTASLVLLHAMHLAHTTTLAACKPTERQALKNGIIIDQASSITAKYRAPLIENAP
jgi:hypothetical protein